MVEPHKPTYELRTRQLRVRALSLKEASLLANGDVIGLSARIEAFIPPGWPGQDLIGALPTIIAEMRRQAGDERWLWVVIEPATSTVIGDIGFHGPVSGATTVELGYLILPNAQGRGYATEASQALLDWTLGRPSVERVIARIAPDNAASLRVAAKLGMREVTSAEPSFRRFEWLTSEHRRA